MSKKETTPMSEQAAPRGNGKRGLLGGLLALAGLTTAASTATAISLDQAPRAWIVYAQKSNQTITAWLNGDATPGPRLRETVFAHAAQLGQAPQPLLLSLWIGTDGAVTRVEFRPLGDEQSDKDLRTLLLGHRLTRPPKNILMPMRLKIQFAPPKKAA
ncbi:MAG TPA: hypothetical protein VGM26_14755 [Rhizomicrobium sp.]|jgi:hypothetical protein